MDSFRIYSDSIFCGARSVYDTSIVNRLCYWAHGYLLSNINQSMYQVILSHENNDDFLKILNLPNTNYYKIPQLYYNLNSKKISYSQYIEFLDKKDLPTTDMELILDDSSVYTIDGKINEVMDKIEIKNEHLENSIITNENYIGIHLRRGRGVIIDQISKSSYIDNNLFHETIDFLNNNLGSFTYPYTTDEKIFDFIDKVQNIDNNIKFYIATDLPHEITSYFTLFKDKNIITSHNFIKNIHTISYQTGLSYEVVRGFFDLFSLAKCGKIIKTPNSTYSQFASLYKSNEKQEPKYDVIQLDNLIVKILGKRFR